MMQYDRHSMADKILSDLESIIRKDEQLEGFVVVPVTLSQNKSPVIHVEHNLCLESWCVKHVYSYAYRKLLEVRKSVAKMNLLDDQSAILNRLLLGTLLINPDVATFWNMRRELVCDQFLNISSELRITKIILTYKSKSNEAFAYRKWLLKRILINEIPDNSRIDSLLMEELLVCDMAAQKSPNNYHAWCHRIWCVENFLDNCTDVTEVLNFELNYTENWISTHVSEHTGFHYRQHIINYIIKNVHVIVDKKYTDSLSKYFQSVVNLTHMKPCDILIYILGKTEQKWSETNISLIFNTVTVLIYELTLNDELNNIFFEHESIFYHRRYIFHNILSVICFYFGVYTTNISNLNVMYMNDNRGFNIVSCDTIAKSFIEYKIEKHGEKYPKMLRCDVNIIQLSVFYKLLLHKEKLVLDKLHKKSVRNSDLVQRYKKWLKYILGIADI